MKIKKIPEEELEKAKTIASLALKQADQLKRYRDTVNDLEKETSSAHTCYDNYHKKGQQALNNPLSNGDCDKSYFQVQSLLRKARSITEEGLTRIAGKAVTIQKQAERLQEYHSKVQGLDAAISENKRCYSVFYDETKKEGVESVEALEAAMNPGNEGYAQVQAKLGEAQKVAKESDFPSADVVAHFKLPNLPNGFKSSQDPETHKYWQGLEELTKAKDGTAEVVKKDSEEAQKLHVTVAGEIDSVVNATLHNLVRSIPDVDPPTASRNNQSIFPIGYARVRLSEKLVAEIDSDNVEGVEAIYASAEDESKQAALLEGITKRAIQKSQLGIIDWVFGTEAFRVAPNSLNNDIYHQAYFTHSLNVWKALVQNGFDLNAHHSEFIGDALSLEAYHGNVDIVLFVLENGQGPNKAWGYDDQEPALLAMTGEKPSLEIIRLMLRHGWKQRDSTALIAAAELGNLEAVQLLVEYGADLEHAQNEYMIC
ncbi:multiple ankyrin repeats single kh domain protein [Beauveria bassiana ARSEF 2860]|uniref:Multiple ankyrin repeats single kh domain protein n=1 Tax=Beauveria bassiana (strain ARSEF 2860) TaxID=655819 RepID=J5JPW0_BEAB2|nr:multiple ankyrin repeats single kh domain protein [Beauveria bassiana ARSEF 2860]EJP67133.1 multiple ankyrin repeats single kh domain protein [Beauveria bassiana ARSEF 2860]